MKRKIVLLLACFSVGALSAQEEMSDVGFVAETSDTLISTVSTSAAPTPGSTTIEKKGLFRQKKQKDIIKKGFSFGPLPVVAFDRDRGL